MIYFLFQLSILDVFCLSLSVDEFFSIQFPILESANVHFLFYVSYSTLKGYIRAGQCIVSSDHHRWDLGPL